MLSGGPCLRGTTLAEAELGKQRVERIRFCGKRMRRCRLLFDDT